MYQSPNAGAIRMLYQKEPDTVRSVPGSFLKGYLSQSLAIMPRLPYRFGQAICPLPTVPEYDI